MAKRWKRFAYDDGLKSASLVTGLNWLKADLESTSSQPPELKRAGLIGKPRSSSLA